MARNSGRRACIIPSLFWILYLVKLQLWFTLLFGNVAGYSFLIVILSVSHNSRWTPYPHSSETTVFPHSFYAAPWHLPFFQGCVLLPWMMLPQHHLFSPRSLRTINRHCLQSALLSFLCSLLTCIFLTHKFSWNTSFIISLSKDINCCYSSNANQILVHQALSNQSV